MDWAGRIAGTRQDSNAKDKSYLPGRRSFRLARRNMNVAEDTEDDGSPGKLISVTSVAEPREQRLLHMNRRRFFLVFSVRLAP